MTTREPLQFPFPPGTVIDGRILVKDGIEVGGMGYVFPAWDKEVERNCMLKTILPELHPKFRPALDLCELMKRERVTAAKLAVDNDFVPQIFQGGSVWVSAEVEGQRHELDLPYYLMERLNGITFERVIRLQRQQQEFLPWADVVELALLCAKAVQAVHRRGFVHRDIKPSNVFLHEREDGSLIVKLIDCGISARIGDAVLFGTGTARFGSPETFRIGNTASEASDNYALALVVYELALWRGPFVAPDPRGYAYAHQFEPPQGIRQTPAAGSGPTRYRRDAPPELEAMLLRALDKKPTRRPSTDAMLEVLENVRAVLSRSTGARGPNDLGDLLSSARHPATRKSTVLQDVQPHSGRSDPLAVSTPAASGPGAESEGSFYLFATRSAPAKIPAAGDGDPTDIVEEKTEPVTHPSVRDWGEAFEMVWRDTVYMPSVFDAEHEPMDRPFRPPPSAGPIASRKFDAAIPRSDEAVVSELLAGVASRGFRSVADDPATVRSRARTRWPIVGLAMLALASSAILGGLSLRSTPDPPMTMPIAPASSGAVVSAQAAALPFAASAVSSAQPGTVLADSGVSAVLRPAGTAEAHRPVLAPRGSPPTAASTSRRSSAPDAGASPSIRDFPEIASEPTGRPAGAELLK